jgi:CheY-like chemotaxis protein
VPDPASVTILVIDDDEEILDIVQDALLPLGYQLELAARAEEGLKTFREKRIDLTILDIFMPGKDGLETLMQLRTMNREAKILAISGGGEIGLRRALNWAEKMGAKGILPKPFMPEELIRKVAQLLKKPTVSNSTGAG